MLFSELKEYLDFKSVQYNTRDFIETDPIQIPHRFNQKEDIEIIAFLVSTIAWGKRAMINKVVNVYLISCNTPLLILFKIMKRILILNLFTARLMV